ncbi:hypothetical protein [Reinekea marinisedimentorum]|uniref:DUF4149 domain-containing protein n=1 Tax=Reinekea marinisedimentorum TaxID=230495 RepID=A0A4R3I7C0_9GAMM|nr:hypothetical protein [Reinekea marinisedimentorum]TCS40009.1 hypothetical protein BCF53_111104 [Reinekea marinisedimentorum]
MIERRTQKPDLLTRLLQAAAALGWIAIFLVQILAWIGAPELDTGIARYHELDIRQTWQKQWVQWMPFLLGACTLLSLFALGVRPLRSRRKTDPKRLHLLALLALTALGYGLYWFQILGNVA